MSYDMRCGFMRRVKLFLVVIEKYMFNLQQFIVVNNLPFDTVMKSCILSVFRESLQSFSLPSSFMNVLILLKILTVCQ